MKTATMTFRIEEDLRQQFNEAAMRVHRPAAQIIRELMREFVEKNIDGTNSEPARETVTTSFYVGGEEYQITQPVAKTMEELERRKAMEFAIANSELEGYKTPDEFRNLMEQVVIGEITIEDVRRDIEERYADFFVKQ